MWKCHRANFSLGSILPEGTKVHKSTAIKLSSHNPDRIRSHFLSDLLVQSSTLMDPLPLKHVLGPLWQGKLMLILHLMVGLEPKILTQLNSLPFVLRMSMQRWFTARVTFALTWDFGHDLVGRQTNKANCLAKVCTLLGRLNFVPIQVRAHQDPHS